MACDSGASFHYLDEELLPNIADDMFDCVKFDPPMKIITAGRHLRSGTGRGVLHTPSSPTIRVASTPYDSKPSLFQGWENIPSALLML